MKKTFNRILSFCLSFMVLLTLVPIGQINAQALTDMGTISTTEFPQLTYHTVDLEENPTYKDVTEELFRYNADDFRALQSGKYPLRFYINDDCEGNGKQIGSVSISPSKWCVAKKAYAPDGCKNWTKLENVKVESKTDKCGFKVLRDVYYCAGCYTESTFDNVVIDNYEFGTEVYSVSVRYHANESTGKEFALTGFVDNNSFLDENGNPVHFPAHNSLGLPSSFLTIFTFCTDERCSHINRYKNAIEECEALGCCKTIYHNRIQKTSCDQTLCILPSSMDCPGHKTCSGYIKPEPYQPVYISVNYISKIYNSVRPDCSSIITQRDAAGSKSLLNVLEENGTVFTLNYTDERAPTHSISVKVKYDDPLITYSEYSSLAVGKQEITATYDNNISTTFTIFNNEFISNVIDRNATSKNGIYYNEDGNFFHGSLPGENKTDLEKRIVLKDGVTVHSNDLQTASYIYFYKDNVNIAQATIVIYGDIFPDGEITSKDVSLLENIINDIDGAKKTLFHPFIYACDVNRDNIIDNKDLAKVKEAAALYEKLERLEKGSAEYEKTLEEYQNCIPQGSDLSLNPDNNDSKPSLWERFVDFIKKILAFFGIKI